MPVSPPAIFPPYQAEEVASGTYDVLWDLCLRVSLNVSMTITVGVCQRHKTRDKNK